MPQAARGFPSYYRQLADEELLRLALQGAELEDSAAVALDAELAARKLGEDAIREFEHRLHTETDAQEEPQQQPAAESGDERGEISFTGELPPDWFDESSDTRSVHVSCLRPKGVTAAVLLFAVAAVVRIPLAWALIGSGYSAASYLTVAFGVIAALLAVVQLLATVALWHMKEWARKVMVGFCWLAVVVLAVVITSAAIYRLRGFTVDPVLAFVNCFGFFWNILWACYFSSERTREAFAAVTQARDDIRH